MDPKKPYTQLSIEFVVIIPQTQVAVSTIELYVDLKSREKYGVRTLSMTLHEGPYERVWVTFWATAMLRLFYDMAEQNYQDIGKVAEESLKNSLDLNSGQTAEVKPVERKLLSDYGYNEGFGNTKDKKLYEHKRGCPACKAMHPVVCQEFMNIANEPENEEKTPNP
jgi:hypothetical protein